MTECPGFWNIFHNLKTCSLMRDYRQQVLGLIGIHFHAFTLIIWKQQQKRIRVYFQWKPALRLALNTATSLLQPLYPGLNKRSVSHFPNFLIPPDFCVTLVTGLTGNNSLKWITFAIINCCSSSTSPTSIPFVKSRYPASQRHQMNMRYC